MDEARAHTGNFVAATDAPTPLPHAPHRAPRPGNSPGQGMTKSGSRRPDQMVRAKVHDLVARATQ